MSDYKFHEETHEWKPDPETVKQSLREFFEGSFSSAEEWLAELDERIKEYRRSQKSLDD
jgi:hypothetical protein